VIDSLIFGFGHRARHGKDTVAAAIKEARGGQYDILILPFAAALKKEVNDNAMRAGGMIKLFDDGLRMPGTGYMQENENILTLPDWVQYDPNAPMDDPLCPYGKQRTLLQWWGTEFRRSANPSYWVNKHKEEVEKEKPEVVLIPDVRFFNEVMYIGEYGDKVKVFNPRIPLTGTKHASEEELANYDGWDATIINDGSLDDLKQKAVDTFDMLMSVQR
jgi:hypothetical protein